MLFCIMIHDSNFDVREEILRFSRNKFINYK